jgi:hypothetical protein
MLKLFTNENQTTFFSISCINQEIPDLVLLRVVVRYRKEKNERRNEKDDLKSTISKTFIERRTTDFRAS